VCGVVERVGSSISVFVGRRMNESQSCSKAQRRCGLFVDVDVAAVVSAEGDTTHSVHHYYEWTEDEK